MNTKYLIETLTEIPDPDLLKQLSQLLIGKPLMIPNLNLLFNMFNSLLSCNHRSTQLNSIHLFQKLIIGEQTLMKNDIEQAWSIISLSVIRMLGQQDAEVRKKAGQLIVVIIDQTNNANIILEKLFYEGMENQSILVIIQSIKQCHRILELYPTILHNKTSVGITKLIIQKLIGYAYNQNHVELRKTAIDFFNKLFYLKVDRLDDVLILINEQLLQKLEKIWAIEKEKLLVKEAEQQEKQNKIIINEIKYQHLPLINGKFFNIFEPYILKNIFNPELHTAKNMAIKHFRQGFENHEAELQKYLNVIFKILIRFLHQQHYDFLFILKKIIMMNGINNIVNLSILPELLIAQLHNDNVIYRKDLREILKKLNYSLAKKTLSAYHKEIQKDQGMDWIKLHEILILLEHWIDSNLEEAYPPALNPFLGGICRNLEDVHVKIREKSLQLLLTTLDRYPGYRQNLQQLFSEERIGEIEDIIEKRKLKGKLNPIAKEAQEIFMKQYQEQRARYMHYQKNK